MPPTPAPTSATALPINSNPSFQSTYPARNPTMAPTTTQTTQATMSPALLIANSPYHMRANHLICFAPLSNSRLRLAPLPATRSRRVSVVLVDFVEIGLREFEMRIIHRSGGDVLAHMLDRDPVFVDAAHCLDWDERGVHSDP